MLVCACVSVSVHTHTHTHTSLTHLAVVWFQEKYIEVASELIVYTHFFSASEEVLPEVR